jgi:hypothetical protein
MYEIEHHVPIPPRWASRRTPTTYDPNKYQWGRLDVGDSFVVPCDDLDEQVAVRMRLLASSRRYAKRWGWQFTTRLEPLGVRIWRVA